MLLKAGMDEAEQLFLFGCEHGVRWPLDRKRLAASTVQIRNMIGVPLMFCKGDLVLDQARQPVMSGSGQKSSGSTETAAPAMMAGALAARTIRQSAAAKGDSRALSCERTGVTSRDPSAPVEDVARM